MCHPRPHCNTAVFVPITVGLSRSPQHSCRPHYHAALYWTVTPTGFKHWCGQQRYLHIVLYNCINLITPSRTPDPVLGIYSLSRPLITISSHHRLSRIYWTDFDGLCDCFMDLFAPCFLSFYFFYFDFARYTKLTTVNCCVVISGRRNVVHGICASGVTNVLITTPLWVANMRLKLQGTTLKTGTESHGSCGLRAHDTHYTGLVGQLPDNATTRLCAC